MKQSDWDFRKANQVTITTFKGISMTSPSKNSAGLDSGVWDTGLSSGVRAGSAVALGTDSWG